MQERKKSGLLLGKLFFPPQPSPRALVRRAKEHARNKNPLASPLQSLCQPGQAPLPQWEKQDFHMPTSSLLNPQPPWRAWHRHSSARPRIWSSSVPPPSFMQAYCSAGGRSRPSDAQFGIFMGFAMWLVWRGSWGTAQAPLWLWFSLTHWSPWREGRGMNGG